MTIIERLEPRVCMAVTTGATITADQAAIQTAATACDTAESTLYSVVGTDDGSVYAAAGSVTAKAAAILAKAQADAKVGVALLSTDLQTLTAAALSATATAANDASQLLAAFSTGLEKALVADERALAASVGKPLAKVDALLARTTVDGEFKALRVATSTDVALRTAIDQRLADSKSLRAALVAAGATLKGQVTAFAKSLKQLHGG